MEKAGGNYNGIAWIYDTLSSLVFGKKIIRAYSYYLDFIKPGNTVLIAGGGTGIILEQLAQKCPEPIHITFLDASDKMITLATKRNYKPHNVEFIHKRIEQFKAQEYDVVITPFLLDNFNATTLGPIWAHINSLLKPGGLWLFSDFTVQAKSQLWQKTVLHIMYIFFRITCGVEAKRLPDFRSPFIESGYTSLETQIFLDGFITSIMYRKPYL